MLNIKKKIPNIGTLDKSVRLLLVVLLLFLFYTNKEGGGVAILLLLLALLFSLTSLVSYSFIYDFFHINTIYARKKKRRKKV